MSRKYGPISGLCECADTSCQCSGQCTNEGTIVLYRVDTEDDVIGVRFCNTCADDALESGIFCTEFERTNDDSILDIFLNL